MLSEKRLEVPSWQRNPTVVLLTFLFVLDLHKGIKGLIHGAIDGAPREFVKLRIPGRDASSQITKNHFAASLHLEQRQNHL